jgi:hypothetical protein
MKSRVSNILMFGRDPGVGVLGCKILYVLSSTSISESETFEETIVKEKSYEFKSRHESLTNNYFDFKDGKSNRRERRKKERDLKPYKR